MDHQNVDWFAEDRDQLELMHYGVKGMKWGVRNDRKRAAKYSRTAKYYRKKDTRIKGQYEKLKGANTKIYGKSKLGQKVSGFMNKELDRRANKGYNTKRRQVIIRANEKWANKLNERAEKENLKWVVDVFGNKNGNYTKATTKVGVAAIRKTARKIDKYQEAFNKKYADVDGNSREGIRLARQAKKHIHGLINQAYIDAGRKLDFRSPDGLKRMRFEIGWNPDINKPINLEPAVRLVDVKDDK